MQSVTLKKINLIQTKTQIFSFNLFVNENLFTQSEKYFYLLLKQKIIV